MFKINSEIQIGLYIEHYIQTIDVNSLRRSIGTVA